MDAKTGYSPGMSEGDRVALRADPSWTGVVNGTPRDGVVAVAGDGGWSATLPESDLQEAS